MSVLLSSRSASPALSDSSNEAIAYESEADSRSNDDNPTAHVKQALPDGAVFAFNDMDANGSEIFPDGKKRFTRQLVDRRKKSTWHLKSYKDSSIAEIIFKHHLTESLHEVKSQRLDRGPVPRSNLLLENAKFLPKVLVPLAIQEISYSFGYKWSVWGAVAVYAPLFMVALLSALAQMDRNCVKYGTFDEKECGRDRCPDEDVNQAALGLALAPFIRLGGVFALWWAATQDVAPSSLFTWTFPLRAVLFFIVDDLFFYTYHRASHQVDTLWFIHQKHHTTRHPSANLSILADQIQEVIEIFAVPFLTSLVVPMTFPELFVTLSYVMFAEIGGHTGMRMYIGHPILTPFLEPLGAALVLECHDLHHRNGKSGKFYGKQSMLWDRIFGTAPDASEDGGLVECRGV